MVEGTLLSFLSALASAVVKIKDYFDEKLKDKAENFSNGRLSRNIYDNLVMAHAKRMISINNPSKEELSLLLPDDFSFSW